MLDKDLYLAWKNYKINWSNKFDLLCRILVIEVKEACKKMDNSQVY